MVERESVTKTVQKCTGVQSHLKDHTNLFLTSHHQKRLPLSSTNVLFKCDHVFTLVDVRLHFQISFTAIHVETGDRNSIGHVKVASYR